VPFAGWVYDTTGSYAQAFQALFILYGIAAVIVAFYRAPAPVIEQRVSDGAEL
jgi:hypothetical protein